MDFLSHGWRPWLTLAIALVGNCGFWLFWYNRINATGLRRTLTKRIEKVFVVLCFVLPLLIGWIEFQALSNWLQSTNWAPTNAPLFRIYGGWCIASFLVMGSLWVASRRYLIPPRHLLRESQEQYDVHGTVGGTPATPVTKFLQRIPGNQIGKLTVTRKDVQLARNLESWSGFRIGHISDIHLTGQYRIEHHEFVFDRMAELEADLIILSGDIIDYERCLPLLSPLLSKLQAPLGVSFVLGNHDRRLPDLEALSNEITQLGFYDLGKTNQTIEVSNRGTIQLIGNEAPWLERHLEGEIDGQRTLAAETPGPQELRIGVCHTPDCYGWAQTCDCDLLFAGHTHGGQMRLPILGPILAPSLHGSKFASGLFYLPPTLMHVTRGVAGTHPLRLRCPPEISLITLQS